VVEVPDVQPRYRRTLLIYGGAIVLPAIAFLWLGIRSVESQRQALLTLRADKLTRETEAAIRAAAVEVLAGKRHPIAKYLFEFDSGVLVSPALDSPPPQASPAEFEQAEDEELSRNRPDLALESYRRLLNGGSAPLALGRVARCLAKLGRHAEARAAWRALATKYPDERDLAGRPWGIVAAIEAGDVAGLFELISTGRWTLAADQAEYFLRRLSPGRHSVYLQRFEFARELHDRFSPPQSVPDNGLNEYAFGTWRIFWRGGGIGRIVGMAVDDEWVSESLRPRLKRHLGITDNGGHEAAVYGAAVAAVTAVLLAGLVLLLRDVSREARINRLRSHFVSSVSHELKTPIAVIRLYGETLLEHEYFDDRKRREFYATIARESRRLAALVDRVLDFSRTERGSKRYRLEEGDPVAVVARTLDDYSEYLEREGFALHRRLPPSVPSVRFDASALSQAVVNLLENAVKHSGDAREVSVCVQAQESEVVVEVQDRGPGIPKSEQPKIFEPFYQVPNEGSKGGCGLGLFLVRNIMKAHGGRVAVNSEPGQGSRFRLILPVVTV
jgi:signal transduction histidine kinase